MRIKSVELIKCNMELAEPYEVAYQRFTHADNILIRISTATYDGWGCIAPDPEVTGETVPEIYEKARDILPALLKGEDYLRRALLMKKLKKLTPGLFSLWAGVDTALWDLLGKKADLPVWKIIGGYRERIQSSITIGITGTAETLAQTGKLINDGWRIIKIKGGNDVNTDIERIQQMRKRFGKQLHIRFDANQGYTTDEALYFIKETEEQHLELIEQPTKKSSPELLGVVSDKSSIPVMADESLISLFDAFHLVRHDLVDLMNIKLMKVGGITEAVQVDAVARAAGVEVMVGCMDEAEIGIAAGLHFALSRRNIRFADLDGHIGLLNDPSAGIIRIKNGYLYPSENPGFGWDGI